MPYITGKDYLALGEQAALNLCFLDWRDGDELSIFTTINGTMLFPTEEEKRKLWIARSLLFARMNGIPCEHDGKIYGGEEYTDSTACEDFKLLAEYFGGFAKFSNVLATKQLNSIFSEAEKREKNGLLSGRIFMIALEKKCSISDAIEFIIEHEEKIAYNNKNYRNIHTKEYIEKNIWPKYLPAVHLWASLLICFRYRDLCPIEDINIYTMFKSSSLRQLGLRDGLIGFLDIAEGKLFEGLNTFPKRTGPRTPLLNISKMVFITHNKHKVSNVYTSGALRFVL